MGKVTNITRFRALEARIDKGTKDLRGYLVQLSESDFKEHRAVVQESILKDMERLANRLQGLFYDF